MIVYVPTPITSVEQAESLPEGTIMFLPAGPYVWTARDPGGEFLDHYGRPWHFGNTQDDEPFTALVPIEAEEETTEQIQVYRGVAHIGPSSVTPAPSRRLVTPWATKEEA